MALSIPGGTNQFGQSRDRCLKMGKSKCKNLFVGDDYILEKFQLKNFHMLKYSKMAAYKIDIEKSGLQLCK